MKNKIVMIIVAIVIAGGAFFGGIQFEKGKISNMTPQQLFAQRGDIMGNSGIGNIRGGIGVRGGNGGISGQVISKDSGSITVKNQDGSSKIVIINSSTGINKYAAGTLMDINIGESVIVGGTANSDGSVTAQTIQIRPNLPTPSSTSINKSE
jgi:hypothetical protein